MHILQTRPQGETAAERNLQRRGVKVIRPREIVVSRKRQANGQRVSVEKEVSLMPTYIVAEPDNKHDLDVALVDMAMREQRRDVQRVIGFASPEAMRHVMNRHMRRVEPPTPVKIAPKMLCEIVGGPMANGDKPFRVRVKMIGRSDALCEVSGFTLRIPLEHLRPVDDKKA